MNQGPWRWFGGQPTYMRFFQYLPGLEHEILGDKRLARAVHVAVLVLHARLRRRPRGRRGGHLVALLVLVLLHNGEGPARPPVDATEVSRCTLQPTDQRHATLCRNGGARVSPPGESASLTWNPLTGKSFLVRRFLRPTLFAAGASRTSCLLCHVCGLRRISADPGRVRLF